MSFVRRCAIPDSCALAQLPPSWATWSDAWEAPLTRRDATAFDLFTATMGPQPVWLDAALRLRDLIGGLFGIRPVGAFSQETRANPPDRASVAKGDRLGIFTVLDIEDDELFVGEDDRHLDYRLVFQRDMEGGRFVVAMMLRTHNLLGRLYMLPVSPVHRHLVRRMLLQASARGDI